ncbi:MAG TPA: hypothetical protein DCL38_03800 [Lachnospiraceae bacterium]|nr:hypothetical protein [Lachnospiraceae bacterium]
MKTAAEGNILMENGISQVLIVDDMMINRMILSSLLSAGGVASDQAENGRECLEMCKKKDYDLILLDHRMPEPDGVDTFVALKEIFKKRGRSVPVICHTTDEGRKNINLYKAAGFSDVLIKPIEPEQLSEVLLTWLPRRKERPPMNTLSGTAAEKTGKAPGETDISRELDLLPGWLKTVPHIDLVSGITNCGSAEDYVDALYIFHSSISEKAADIRTYLENEDRTMFRLTVHSLKSMSGLIGARALREKAAFLETCAGNGDLKGMREETPGLLSSYLAFSELLSPVLKEEGIKDLKRSRAASSDRKSETAPALRDLSKTILFVQAGQDIVTKGIENNLKNAGFSVISVPDQPEMIITCRFEADIILYYPGRKDDPSHIGLIMSLLGEICQDDSRILCLTGEVADIETAISSNSAFRVSRTYPRPVDINVFLKDMDTFSELSGDYRRRKNIYIVDDDPEYLSVIDRWLSADYGVSCFRRGSELISGLNALTPDLILMDYEMPEMDGYELMKRIRSNPVTCAIPTIFLTGKNDRDHVFRILEYKPDGYLLKTSQKDTLLDAIHRFFAEAFFRRTLPQ